jgi:hypothetical protein
MDEAIRIDADRDALQDVEGARPMANLVPDRSEMRLGAGEPLAPGFG